jgi:hypothetical protein
MRPQVFLAILAACAAAFACFDANSVYYSGVVFNNGETVDFTPLLKMGTMGVNYFYECDPAAGQGDSVRLISGKQDLAGKPFDDCRIDSVKVADNTLTLQVSYSGGCKTHEFALYALDTLFPSKTPHGALYLSHNGNGDQCKAIVGTTLRFNLATLGARFVVGTADDIVFTMFTDTARFGVSSASWKLQKMCAISYRGHYGVNTMVHLGNITPPNLPSLTIPRILVYLDTTKKTTPAEKALAVATELRWLSLQKAMTFTETGIDAIQGKLAVHGDQYWTRQDSALPYNMWFEYDSVKGAWSNGTVGVKGVRGSYGCGAGVVYALPIGQLGSSPVLPGSAFSLRTVMKKPGARAAFYDLKGRKLSGATLNILHRFGGGVHIVVDGNGIRPLVDAGK